MPRRWLIAVLVVAAATPLLLHAQGATVVPAPRTVYFEPEVPLPGFLGGAVSSSTFIEYLRAVFVYFMGLVGILGVVMVIWGGIKWVAAAGNPGRINDARDQINSAIIGIIIALTSVLLLNLINPRLTSFAGLTLKPVQPELLQFINEIQQATGSVTRCPKTIAAGDPAKVCSGRSGTINPQSKWSYDCVNANDVVNKWVQHFSTTGVDGPAIKALIQIESPKLNGLPYSGPEGANGPGYGLGQFKVPTLVEVLPKVNVPAGLPPGCHTPTEVYDADGVHLSQTCRDWLDDRSAGTLGTGISGMNAQIGMMTEYFGQQLEDRKCVNGDLALAAAAYNQGLGGASDAFCSTTYINDPVKRERAKNAAIDYINKFKAAYSTACASAQ